MSLPLGGLADAFGELLLTLRGSSTAVLAPAAFYCLCVSHWAAAGGQACISLVFLVQLMDCWNRARCQVSGDEDH